MEKTTQISALTLQKIEVPAIIRKNYTYLYNQFFMRVCTLQHKGKVITPTMLSNWFYGKTEYEILQKEFLKFIKEEHPELEEEIYRQID